MFERIKKVLKKENIIPSALLLLVIISCIVTVFTYSVGLNGYDGFDYLEDIYWAKATLESKSLVSPDYNYVYIIPFGANLIMAPFVAVFGISLISNQLGMAVYFIIYLLTVCYLTSSIFDEVKDRMYFMAIVTMFVLTLVGDSLFHHILAYGIGFISFMGELASLINIYKHDKKNIIHYILLAIFSSWSSFNGLGVAALSTIPIVGSTIVYCYIKRINPLKIERKIINAFIVIGITTLAGLTVFKVLNNGRDFGSFVFCDTDTIIQRPFFNFFKDLFNIFFFTPKGIPFFSTRGLVFFMRLFFSFVIFIIPIFYIFKKTSKTQIELFITISCMILLTVSYAMWLFSAKSTERTLFNGVLGLLIICGIAFNSWLCKVDKREVFLSKVVLVILVVFLSSKHIIHSYRRGNELVDSKQAIIDALKENGLSFGYSTSFYYVRQLSVISNEEVETVMALYSGDKKKFIIESTSTLLHERSKPADIDRTYIIIPDSEVWNGIEDEDFDNLIDNNIKMLNLDECIVFIFNMKDFDKVFTFDED